GQETYALPNPFFVIATQNPIEQEGTYPLPEAQQDRFMFNLWVDYPSLAEEKKILATTTSGEEPELQTVLNDRQILNMQKLVANVPVSDYVIEYAARLVRATRPRDESAPDFVRKMVEWGAGPRAGQYLILAGKSFAAMNGQVNVGTVDIRRAALPVLRHRISCNFVAQSEGVDAVEIIRRLVEAVPEPEPSKYASATQSPIVHPAVSAEFEESIEPGTAGG
ncbi:MAG: MoxR family ATPase, partial [Phycisphaerae bacterium]